MKGQDLKCINGGRGRIFSNWKAGGEKAAGFNDPSQGSEVSSRNEINSNLL